MPAKESKKKVGAEKAKVEKAAPKADAAAKVKKPAVKKDPKTIKKVKPEKKVAKTPAASKALAAKKKIVKGELKRTWGVNELVPLVVGTDNFRKRKQWCDDDVRSTM